MTTNSTSSPTGSRESSRIDLAAVKKRQQATWASGDFSIIGTTLQIVGESLCEAVDVLAGERVLDVACGNGNATLAAARRFASVAGVDYVPALLQRGAERAAAERLKIEFVEGDAEELPFADATFDAVLSSFGVMFTADQERAARELLRVSRPGGRIGLANWTPEGFIGKFFQVVGRFVAPPAGVASPLRWGTEAGIEALFGVAKRSVRLERKHFMFRYESAEHMLEIFRAFYGPTLRAFAALDPSAQQGLGRDLIDLMLEFNRGGSASLVVPGEYLEIVIER